MVLGRWAHRATLVCGALVVLLGLAGSLGWLLEHPRLARVQPGWPAMSPVMAAGFVLSGTSLILLATRRAFAALACAGGAIGLGLLGMLPAERLGGAPNGGASLLLGGAALALLARERTRYEIPALLATAVLVLATASLAGYATGLQDYYAGWSLVSGMAAHSAVGFGVLALGCIAADAKAKGRTSADVPRQALAIGVSVAAVMLVLWSYAVSQERDLILRNVRHEARIAEQALSSRLQGQIDALVRLAARWTPRSVFEQDAALFLEHEPAFEAIAWVRPGGSVPWVVDRATREGTGGLDVSKKRGREALAKRMRSAVEGPGVGTPFELDSGLLGLAARAPLGAGAGFDGHVVAVLRAQELIAGVLEAIAPRYRIRIAVGADTLFETTPPPSNRSPVRWSTEMELHGRRWALELAPRRAVLSQLQSAALEMALGVALGLAALSAWLVEAARRARENQQRFHQVVEHVDDAFYLRRWPESDVLYVSPVYEKVFGFPSPRYGEFAESIHPDDRERVESERRSTLPGPLELTYRIVLPDGRIRWIHERAFPVPGLGGSVDRIAGLASDVTEERAREARMRLAAIVESSADAIISKTLDGRIVSWNQGAERIYGYGASEVLGRSIELLVPPHRIGDLKQVFRRVQRGERIGPYDTERVHKDGHLIDVSLTVSPVRDDRGVVVGVSAITRDISELKRARDELTQQRDALRWANAELERSNSELEQFAYVASHDLQEPLRKIVAFSELLEYDLGKELSEDADRDLAFVLEAARRMQALVRDLLLLSTTGREPLRKERVALDACADDVLDALAVQVEEKGARIERDPLPTVEADPMLLRLVYQNLLSNALKFSDGRAPVVRLTARESADGWVLGVRDDGIGIRSNHLDAIFQPFRRLHPREVFEGTGIGLAICRRAIDRLGGRIWVDSEPGDGSHFQFTVPG